MSKRNRLLKGKSQVVIVEDCRNVEQKANGQVATFLGRYRLKYYPETRMRYRGPRELLACPVFLLPDGTKIWGLECWWRRVESTNQPVGDGA